MAASTLLDERNQGPSGSTLDLANMEDAKTLHDQIDITGSLSQVPEYSSPPPSSGLSQGPEFESESSWSQPSSLRISYAEEYERALQAVLKTATPEALRDLNNALAKVHAEDIDPISAERVMSSVQPLLNGEDTAHTLLACQTLVEYDLKRAEAPSIKSPVSPEHYTMKFRQISKLSGLDHARLATLADTVELWTALVRLREVEEHQSYHLAASALHWMSCSSKSSNEAHARNRFMDLFVATYAMMPRPGRYRIVHDLLSVMLRCPELMRDLVHTVLRLVAITGSVSLTTWSEAVSLRKRQLVESDARSRHTEAVALCQMISRRVIEFGYMSSKGAKERDVVQSFVTECASSLMDAQVPSAELLVSGFISTLFNVGKSHRDRKYCLFSFNVLRIFHDMIALLVYDTDEHQHEAVDLVAMVAAVEPMEQALYMASRQCTLPDQPFYDLHLALENKTQTKEKGGYITNTMWIAFLGQWPISGYYQHICHQICALADREDLPDNIQIELFKILEGVVGRNPSIVNHRWLDRLSYASASVCETLVPVIAALFQDNAQQRPYAILHKVGTRLAVPGVKQFKRRVINLLYTVASLDDEGYETAWLYLLIAAADPDAIVSTAASDKAAAIFFQAIESDPVDSRLSKALQVARSEAGENSYLVQEGLRKFMNRLSVSAKGPQVREFVSNLLEDGDFELAASLVEADGTFMPVPKVMAVFNEVKHMSINQRVSLQILDSALSARPRIILLPAAASQMFSALIARLKTATEREIGHIGRILDELVSLGGRQVQEERRRRLHTLISVSFTKLREAGDLRSAQSKDLVILKQLIMIVGCVRFWGHEQGLEMIGQIVEMLVKLGRRAEAGGQLSQLIVRSVFSIAAEYRVLFRNPELDAYLSSLQRGSPEFDCFMQQLFQYDWHDPDSGAGAVEGDGAEQLKSAIMGTNRQEGALATSSMLQKYLTHILDQAGHQQNIVALRIITKALDNFLIVVDRCLPMIVSLCFSGKLGVAQAALAGYAKVCSRWPSSVLTKIVPGLKQCSKMEDRRVAPFARVWQLARASQATRGIKALVDMTVTSLSHDCTDAYLKLVITGLMQTALDPKDARQLKTGLMEMVTSFSPRNKAHDAASIARMVAVYVFEAWLTRRYGLMSSRAAKDQAENEVLEYMDLDAILMRLHADRWLAKQTFEKLLDERHVYGSKEMDELIYGRQRKELRRDSESGSPQWKRQRVETE